MPAWVALLLNKFGFIFENWPLVDSSIYIARFRGELNNIAKELNSYQNISVWIRYHGGRDSWVGFYSKNGLIAQVRVHGEMGLPDEAIVSSNLSIEEETLFSRLLPGLRMTFKALVVKTYGISLRRGK
ncbi:MAG: hypothetical protein A2937_02930 [Candidatus Yonathbacteria bacterium RIFCSPLOWO2_01_FULL_47_33b]|uniref:Uncharacterized protein n=1 Tax=Candidatus Yonathbacteria bacterium RIFCSPLOWO2_01_FULL_47_33b TaxID=1802727 RepID=A0A1G2SGE8_9BACT|nr:MAG: hypothetical protein A2937_02930 [Candidatus Yonathbacteria bacterium RIFCSPLOWO2_01_FULL_47_33b]